MGDILASTPCEAIINGVYRDELTVAYAAPKPQKIHFTERDLYNSDLFGFGSAIGAITNKSTSAYAMLPLLIEQYGEDSEEVRITISRLQQCCVAQSKQIDKTKIGQKVKGIPKIWTTYQKVNDDDPEEVAERKKLMNRILIDKHPYFFRYRYPDDNKAYVAYQKEKSSACQAKFGLTIEQLIKLENRNEVQDKWVRDYYKYCPLIISNSPMNLLCNYIEGIEADILKRVRDTPFNWHIYEDTDYEVSEEDYEFIIKCYLRHQRDNKSGTSGLSEVESYQRDIELLKEKLYFVNSNPHIIANALLRHAYEERPTASKKIIWDLYGKYFMQAAQKNNPDPMMFPMEDVNGEIEYLGARYTMRRLDEFE